MSCGCEIKRMSSELARQRRLAKALAVMEGEMVVIFTQKDGTYNFKVATGNENDIIEYISPY